MSNTKRFKGMALFCAAVIALAGCSGSSSSQPPPQSGSTPAASTGTASPKKMFLLTGSTGGTFYALGGAIANTWNLTVGDKYQMTAQPTGASVENIKRLATGEGDFGIADNNIADMAWKGEGDTFKETGALTNFRAIGNVYPEVYHGIVAEDSDIQTIADLKGKRVAVGPPGSGTYVICQQVFAEFGLSFSDIEPINAGFGDAVSKFKDKQIDSSWGGMNIPSSQIMDITSVRKVRFLEVKGKDMENLSAKYPFYTQFVIPAGTYDNTEDIYTFSCQATLYCKADLPDDLVYDMTKAYYENREMTAQAHAGGKFISLETAVEGLTTPLHPGAVRYYNEVGVTLPESILP